MSFQAPMLIPFLGLVAGILLTMTGAPIWVCGLLLVVALILYLLLLRLGSDPIRAFKLNRFHFIWIFIIFTSLGLLVGSINKPSEISNSENVIAVKGKITHISQSTNGDRVTIKTDALFSKDKSVIHPENLGIIIYTDATDASVDDEVIVTAKIHDVKASPNYFNTGYATYLKNRGIMYRAYSASNDIHVVGHSASANGIATNVRDRIEAFIEKTDLAKSSQNFLITILLGDRSYLDPELKDKFADAGISHILALSGMHVAIIGGILLWLLFPLNFFGRYKLRLVIATLILFIYAFISGLNPSTVRATVMMTAMTLCILLERKNSAWNSLLLAVFIILLFNPFAIYDVGLQLSFMCVASLIFFVARFNPFNQHDHPRLYRFSSILLSTLIATGATWCVTAYYFGRIPLSFLPVNLVILPLLPVYLTIAIVYFFLHSIGINAVPLRMILDTGYENLIKFVDYLTFDGTSSLYFSPSEVSVMLWIALVILLALAVWKTKKFYGYMALTCALCFVLSVWIVPNKDFQDAYIVQNGWRDITLLSRINGQESTFTAKRKSISIVQLKDHRIGIIDVIEPEKIGQIASALDHLVICGNYKGKIEDLISQFGNAKIILHPSIRKMQEQKFLNEADSLGLECHSIRNTGPYHHIL